MGSNSNFPVKLPVIDFTKEDLKPGSCKWDSVKAEVREALEEYGSFEAVFNRVPLEIHESVFCEVEQLFDLPLETKKLNTFDNPLRGYIGNSPAVPLYESIGIEDPIIFDNVDSLANNFWPHGKPCFSKSVHFFSEKISELDQTIRRMIFESFGLEKYINEYMNSTNYLLRMIKYKAPQSTEKNVGLIAHTDKNILSILHQNQVDGLEVQTRDGKWIRVKPSSPGSYLVFAGETLHAWLNGWLRCAPHRVMMTGEKDRYTIGLFSVPKPGYIIKAPEELVDGEHPLLFKPFDYADFLKFFGTETGLKAESALKAFCGVESVLES